MTHSLKGEIDILDWWVSKHPKVDISVLSSNNGFIFLLFITFLMKQDLQLLQEE